MKHNPMIWSIGSHGMRAQLQGKEQHIYRITRISEVRNKQSDCRHYKLRLPNSESITHKAFFTLLQIANSDYLKSFPNTPMRPLSKYDEHAWSFDMTKGKEKAQLSRGNHIFIIQRGVWVGNPKVSDPLAVFHNGELLGKKLSFFSAVIQCQNLAEEHDLT